MRAAECTILLIVATLCNPVDAWVLARSACETHHAWYSALSCAAQPQGCRGYGVATFGDESIARPEILLQVPLIPAVRNAAQGLQQSDSSAASMSREPAKVQFPEGMASPVPSASPAGGSGGGPRNLKQERTAQNFLRGCARLRMIQVDPCCWGHPTVHAVILFRRKACETPAGQSYQRQEPIAHKTLCVCAQVRIVRIRSAGNVGMHTFMICTRRADPNRALHLKQSRALKTSCAAWP